MLRRSACEKGTNTCFEIFPSFLLVEVAYNTNDVAPVAPVRTPITCSKKVNSEYGARGRKVGFITIPLSLK